VCAVGSIKEIGVAETEGLNCVGLLHQLGRKTISIIGALIVHR
jgi:hypothetical protein